MGTRSLICYYDPEFNGYYAIYCHWDGYPSYNGKILVNHYTELDKIKKLIDLGDISSLGPEIGIKHDFNDHNKNWVNAYHRDREEKYTPPLKKKSIEWLKNYAKDQYLEYVYIFKDNDWKCYSIYDEEYISLDQYKNIKENDNDA